MPVLKKFMFFITGCALLLVFPVPFGMALASGTTSEPTADLRGISVRSGRFPSGVVTLENGEYRGPAASGSASAMIVKLTDQRAFDVVNGRDTAAVIIATDLGGSGIFFDLALLFKGDTGWINVDTVHLGDRVKVYSVDMRNNEIFVSMTAHEPGDALCCPTQEMTQHFTVRSDRLVAQEMEKKTSIVGHKLVGPVWRWVLTRYADDKLLTRTADATGYTLQLKPDGTIQVRGDCNVSGGSFTLNNNKLALTITHSTMAACPDSSLEAPFMRDLSRTSGFILKNGRLFLDLKLDSGTMEFHE